MYFPSIVICNTDNELGQPSQACADLTLMTIWQGRPTFQFDTQREFETDVGTCCWFTPQHNYTEIWQSTKSQGLEFPDWGQWLANVSKGTTVGQDNGFEMVVDLQSYNISNTPTGSSGFRIKPRGLMVALIHHLDQPIMRHSGLLMAPGTTNLVQVDNVVLTSITDEAKQR